MANAMEKKQVNRNIAVGISSKGSADMTNASEMNRNDKMRPLIEIMMFALVAAKLIRSRWVR
jgi:hypothetical protein